MFPWKYIVLVSNSWNFSTHFQYSPQYHGNPSSGRRADTCAWTDGRIDMTKPVGTFRDYVNPPRNVCSQRQCFYARLQNCEERPLASTCLSFRPYVCPFVRPSACNKLGFHWTDFHEILYFNIFRKSVEKIQVSLTL